MIFYIKIMIMRVIMRIFYIFPLNGKRAVITAYSGKQYSCSPKVIAEAMANKNMEVNYALKEGVNVFLPQNIKRIKYFSIKHFYYLMTAKYIVINNSCFMAFLPYRKKQILINTWHGAYSIKTTGNDVYSEKYDMKLRHLAGKQVDIYLSSSSEFIRQHKRAQDVPEEKFLNIGLPRDDIFFQKNDNTCVKVYKELGLDRNCKIVLYAPTYREGSAKSIDEYEFEPIHVKDVICTLSKKFGSDFIFVYRAHHTMVSSNLTKDIVNASNYPDMQDLLVAADILITDYSSCVWDFAIQQKPCFLYTPDIDKFEKVHPFNEKPDKWPYEHYLTNDDLLRGIMDYGYKEQNRIKAFLLRCDSKDDGNAIKRLSKYLKL